MEKDEVHVDCTIKSIIKGERLIFVYEEGI